LTRDRIKAGERRVGIGCDRGIHRALECGAGSGELPYTAAILRISVVGARAEAAISTTLGSTP